MKKGVTKGKKTSSSNGSVWVLVETVGMTRRRYVVKTPADKMDWALDTVVMEEAEPISEIEIGETIVSSRGLKEREILDLAEEDGIGRQEARAMLQPLE